MNDEAYWSHRKETPEERWLRIRNWVVDQISDDMPPDGMFGLHTRDAK